VVAAVVVVVASKATTGRAEKCMMAGSGRRREAVYAVWGVVDGKGAVRTKSRRSKHKQLWRPRLRYD